MSIVPPILIPELLFWYGFSGTSNTVECGFKPYSIIEKAMASASTIRLRDAGVLISMAEVGAAWQNGYAERLMRTIKEEEVDLSEYEDYLDAVRQLGRFLDEVYMHSAFIPPWVTSLSLSLNNHG